MPGPLKAGTLAAAGPPWTKVTIGARAVVSVALANHLVMGPAIVARGLDGRVPYAVKVHGSALEYVVKRDPGRPSGGFATPFTDDPLVAASNLIAIVVAVDAAAHPFARRGAHWAPSIDEPECARCGLGVGEGTGRSPVGAHHDREHGLRGGSDRSELRGPRRAAGRVAGANKADRCSQQRRAGR